MKIPYIPKELLHIILEYDGRIKYRNGKYINIIAKNDKRYDIVKPVISKKMKILETITIAYNGSFSFEFDFDTIKDVGLCFSLGFNSPRDVIEICYYDARNYYDNDDWWKQIRTYI